jgi:hypothetical protein
LSKEIESLTNRSNCPDKVNISEGKDTDSVPSTLRESKIVKSSSHKSLVKKPPLSDRPIIKESKNVFLKLTSSGDKEKFPFLKLKLAGALAHKDNKESRTNFLSNTGSLSSTPTNSSKMTKLTKLYSNTNLIKNENMSPLNTNSVVQDKNIMPKFTLKFKINPLSSNLPSNSAMKDESSNSIFSSHKLTPRGTVSLPVREISFI